MKAKILSHGKPLSQMKKENGKKTIKKKYKQKRIVYKLKTQHQRKLYPTKY